MNSPILRIVSEEKFKQVLKKMRKSRMFKLLRMGRENRLDGDTIVSPVTNGDNRTVYKFLGPQTKLHFLLNSRPKKTNADKRKKP